MKNVKLIHILVLVLVAGAVIFIFTRHQARYDLNPPKQKNMKITSKAFENGLLIPEKYTCRGKNVNPPLEFREIPKAAKSLVLVVDDPDAPMGTWSHWIVWNIKPDTGGIAENSMPENSIAGSNDFGKNDYGGPCPPSGTHRYFFRIYALDKRLDLEASANRADLERAMSEHVIDYGELVGLFGK